MIMAVNTRTQEHKNIRTICFGTDGWRGIIAKDFTFENVRIVTQAIADYLKQIGDSRYGIGDKNSLLQSPISHLSSVVIGYDNRFLSEKFAQEVAKVFAGNKINVIISQTSVTSPSVSFACKKYDCLGVMLTASHNPPIWNGLKLKMHYGGSVSEKVVDTISQNLYKTDVKTGSDKIETVDILTDYKEYLRSVVKLNPSAKLNRMKVVIDSMHGSGSGIFEQLLKNEKKIISIHNYREPLFSNMNPEPIEENLAELKKVVVKNSADVGFAFDGDADRLGVIDDKGRYLPPHIVFPLILLYLTEYKKIKGKVVQTISLGYLSERIAKKFSLPFEEVPVGFKYVCEKMLNEDVLLGGEESGGYGFTGGLLERDGILNALLIYEMLQKTKKKLSLLVDNLQKRFGKSYFLRRDIKLLKPIDKKIFIKDIEQKICNNSDVNSRQFAFPIKEVRSYDGTKIIFEDGNWLLLRPSGTEPVLRIYSETESITKTKKLVDLAEKICFNILL
ncbi:MAG: phosphoglucomutase/phosphomannomutase family protein [Elusimicrobiota bacterium]